MKSKNGRPFFMVYQFFAQELGLRGAAKEVYAIIYGSYVSFDGVAKVSLREMMRLTGLTKQSIINALKALQDAGLIEKTSSATKKSAYKILGIEISPDGKPVKILDQSKIWTSALWKCRFRQNHAPELSYATVFPYWLRTGELHHIRHLIPPHL